MRDAAGATTCRDGRPIIAVSDATKQGGSHRADRDDLPSDPRGTALVNVTR